MPDAKSRKSSSKSSNSNDDDGILMIDMKVTTSIAESSENDNDNDDDGYDDDGGSSIYSGGTGIGSSSRYSVSSDHTRSTNGDDPQYVDPVVAAKEQKQVFYTKLLVFAVLVIAMAITATSAILLVKNDEQADFESQFQGFASEVVSVARQTANQAIDALDSFGVTITSYAKDTNQTWPFVTLPNWSARAERLAKLTGTKNQGLLFAPIVTENHRSEWERYSMEQVPIWYQDSLRHENTATPEQPLELFLNYTSPVIFKVNFTDGSAGYEDRPGPYVVVWQGYPLAFPSVFTNYNLINGPRLGNAYFLTAATLQPVVSFALIDGRAESQIVQPIFEDIPGNNNDNDGNNHERKKLVGTVVVVVDWITYFENVLTADDANGLVVVVKNSCQEEDAVTYRLDGPNATFLGDSDLHDTQYDDMEISAPFVAIDYDESKIPDGRCAPELTLHLYPTKDLEETFQTNNATIYAIVICVIFIFASMVFVLYDFFVGRRQRIVMRRVIQQDKIVSNVFPTAIRKRLYAANNNNNNNEHNTNGSSSIANGSTDDLDRVNGLLMTGGNSAPLAEVYPSVTVCFADIAGFTAWSSAREPPHVFKLLETIYGAFDKLAYRHGAFKVETVGDCYVAVAGLPDPSPDHAVAIAKFARAIVSKMNELTKKLEVALGPDTGDLTLRVGIHTGQVIAGVLRGERARFQLFGDTMNVAARMESTSARDRIQVSATAADQLRKGGLSKWIKPRLEAVNVKGKGDMQTFWLESKKESINRQEARKRARAIKKAKLANKTNSGGNLDAQSCERSVGGRLVNEHGDEEEFEILIGGEDDEDPIDEEDDDDESEDGGGDISAPNLAKMSKRQRLVEWNVQVLSELLQQIVAARDMDASVSELWPGPAGRGGKEGASTTAKNGKPGATVLDEFRPIINLKRFAPDQLQKRRDPSTIELGSRVKSQLRDYLTIVAGMYRNNAFHSWEHASHVTASVRKLLTRIVNVDKGNEGIMSSQEQLPEYNGTSREMTLSDLAGHSYGITSDPLTQFAVVYSAIIHDVDHPGVSNAQLVKEKTRNAQFYKKSIAEQNSVDLAWDLLMSPEYSDLRSCIYSKDEELKRFRQLVVNTVMATDICDKELQALRKARWEVAFSDTAATTNSSSAAGANGRKENKAEAMIRGGGGGGGDNIEAEDRKATIVIEHLIQASDVSHTMQHWHIYKEWNEKFFMEMYGAYRAGRADSDPSVGWYQGEIGFFKFYVIPLAKKLDSCGVFGVSSHEYRNYAEANLEQWTRTGNDIVKEYIEKYNDKTLTDASSTDGYSSSLGDLPDEVIF